MILTNGKTEVCFLHIPRTGGRYVTNLLVNNGYDYAKDFPGSGHRTIHWRGKELLHLNLREEKTLAEICGRTLPENRFTIVRNPVDKFLSFSSMFESFINIAGIGWKEMEDPGALKQVMEQFGFIGGKEGQSQEMFFGFRNMGNNSCIDQRFYIDDTVKVWKFENGLGKNFIEWLNDEMKLDVSQVEVSYPKRSFDDHRRDFSDKLVENLSNYFQNEMQYFGY